MSFQNHVTYNSSYQERRDFSRPPISNQVAFIDLHTHIPTPSHSTSSISSSFTRTNKTIIPVFYFKKSSGVMNDWLEFFKSNLFRSILNDKIFPLAENSNKKLFFNWNKELFTNYLKRYTGCVHQIALLIEFCESMNNQRPRNCLETPCELLKAREMKKIFNEQIQPQISEHSNTSTTEVTIDQTISEVFFIFKTFEFIWFTHNFHSGSQAYSENSGHFGVLRGKKTNMEAREFAGIIIEWNDSLKCFQTTKCTTQFEGPFLINIKKSTPDSDYFNDLSEIPTNYLILPTLSFFNSQEKAQLFKNSQDFGFNRENLQKISNFLNGEKDFVQAINEYLIAGLNLLPLTNQDSNPIIQKTAQISQQTFQSTPSSPKEIQTSDAVDQAFRRDSSTREDQSASLTMDGSSNHRDPLTELSFSNTEEIINELIATEAVIKNKRSHKKHLEFIDFLKQEIWGKPKPAEILLNAIVGGLTKRNGECSFKTDDFETLTQLFNDFLGTDDRNRAIINDCFEFLQIKKIEDGLCSKEQQNIPIELAKLIAPALFMHKLKEILLHANYPNTEVQTKTELPVFFVLPEGGKVRIYCLQGSFEGFVIRKIQNQSSLSCEFLKNSVSDIYAEREENNDCTTILISLKAFEELEAITKNSLILRPTVIKFYQDVIKQKDLIDSPLKTKKNQDELCEDELFEKVGKKRRRLLPTDLQPPKKIHKSTGRIETATERTMNEVDSIQNGIQIIAPTQKDFSEKEGMSQTTQSLLGSQRDSVELSPENFLEKISVITLKETINPIKKRQRLKSVVNQEEIDFLTNKNIEKLGSYKAITPFNPLLKKYQKEAVAKMLHFSDKKLSPFLAAEMGLGKTFMMFEWASQLIARGKEGIHLFLMPVSLLTQMNEEIQRAWFEIMRTAWETRKRLEPKETVQNAVLQALNECQPGSPEMKFLLYAIVPFLNEWLNDQSSETSIDQSIQIYFKTDHIVPEIIDVVNFHLKNIKKVPNWKEEFEEKLKQIEIKKTIDNRETYTHQVDNMVWNIPRDHNPSTTFFLIAATILNIHPGRQYSASLNQPLEEAKRMTDLHMNPPVTCFKAGELAEHLEKPTFNNSGFIMSSFECLQNKKKDIKSLLSCKKIASIVVDEADRLHNMNSRDNQCIKELLENSKKGETLLQLISGTPFQNSFKEIYTLVSLANPPDLFPSITQEKLISSLKHCINRITSKKDIDQKNLSQIVSKTFLDFNKIADLMRKVIIRVSITDKHVIEDWNYQIPSFEIESIFVDLKDEIKNRIQSIKNEKRNFLQQFSQIKQILIHPTLKNLDRKSSEAKSIIKNLELASNEELTQQIENSPLLKGLINSRPIKDCISNNDRTIIFVQNLIEADIIKTVIDKFYQTNQPIVTIYEGSLKIKERNQIIKNFKTEKDGTKPRFLILMTECGGTGLNLQEAARCIIASRSFNPSKDDQARARCIRVNNIGHKIIYEIDYNDSSSVHLRMIRQEKRDWVKFLFTSETDTVEDNFQHWKKLLKTICERKFIKNGVSEKDLRYQLFLKRMEELLFDPADQCEVEVVSNEPLMQDLGSETDISMEDCLEMTTTF